jgi:hypothetical protein
MPAYSTENFTGRNLSPSSTGGWTATRVWMVTGAVNEGEVQTALPLPNSGTLPVAKLNDSHPQNALLICTGLTIEQIGPRAWMLRATYTMPSLTGLPPGDPNPLLSKPRVSWEEGQRAVPFDIDLVGVPVINSTGVPYSPAPTREIYFDILTIKRHEPFFDLQKARLFRNAVNSNTFTSGNVVFLAGECLCTSIKPTQEYTTDATAIEIAYRFQIEGGLNETSTTQGFEPFQLHMRDRGRSSFGQGGSGAVMGPITGADGAAIADDVPLDGTGKPIETTLKVRVDPSGTLVAPIARPTALPKALVPSPYNDPTTQAFVWKWIRHRRVSFAGLNL